MATVIFNDDLCQGCCLCIEACPKKIIELCKNKINVKGFHPASLTNPDECIGCANCALMCPDVVIEINK